MIRLFKRLIILSILVFLLIYIGSILLVALGGAYWQQQYNKNHTGKSGSYFVILNEVNLPAGRQGIPKQG